MCISAMSGGGRWWHQVQMALCRAHLTANVLVLRLASRLTIAGRRLVVSTSVRSLAGHCAGRSVSMYVSLCVCVWSV